MRALKNTPTEGKLAVTTDKLAATVDKLAATAGKLAETAGRVAATAGRVAATAGKLAATAGALAAMAGCAIQVDMPGEFLVTQESRSEFKATTADDAIFWVRKYELPEHGDNLGFWADAVKNDFVDNRGYTLIEEADVETRGGNPGKQFVFEATTLGATYRYLLTLWILPKGLFHDPIACTATFTIEKGEFDAHVESVRKAMLSVRE